MFTIHQIFFQINRCTIFFLLDKKNIYNSIQIFTMSKFHKGLVYRRDQRIRESIQGKQAVFTIN